MRARNIKPDLWKDVALADLPIEARYLFPALWCMADCEGRLEDIPKRIKVEVYPYDDPISSARVNELLQLLAEGGFICRYEVDRRNYIQIRNFVKHQNPHKNEREKGSQIPVPPAARAVPINSGPVPINSEQVPFEDGTARADSLLLIPDSGLLIPSPGVPARSPNPIRESWRADVSYVPFVEAWREIAAVTGKPLIDDDFADAHFLWKFFDPDQKALAVLTSQEHLIKGVWAGNTDPRFIPLPKRYLESEYKRPVVGPKPRDPTPAFAPRKSKTEDMLDRAEELLRQEGLHG